MVLAALYLVLLTGCIAFNLVRSRRAGQPVLASGFDFSARDPRDDRGHTAGDRPFAGALARARLTDYRQWTWGASAERPNYGPPVLAALFVVLDLSRLAVDQPDDLSGWRGEIAHHLAPTSLEPQAGFEPAWAAQAEFAPSQIHDTFDFTGGAGRAWHDLELPLATAQTHDGWLI